jgi:pimeloyl-ACP methyl ester carboxylesterase
MTAAVVASRLGSSIRGLILADPTFLSAQRQREVRDSDVMDQHRRLLGSDKSEVLAQIRGRHPHRSPELVEVLAEARLQTRMATFDVLTPPNPDFRPMVSALAVPTLLVVGDHGAAVSLETARELVGLNPSLRVEHIADAGHGLMYDQPERFEAVVRFFLQSVSLTAQRQC